MHASSFQGGYMDSDDDYDPPKDVIDRDVIESDDDVDRRPAAPGMLQRMRRESVPWYQRIGSNAWCAIALALAVAVWNLPQMVSGTGFFHLIAEHDPGARTNRERRREVRAPRRGIQPGSSRRVHDGDVQDRRALLHHR